MTSSNNSTDGNVAVIAPRRTGKATLSSLLTGALLGALRGVHGEGLADPTRRKAATWQRRPSLCELFPALHARTISKDMQRRLTLQRRRSNKRKLRRLLELRQRQQ